MKVKTRIEEAIALRSAASVAAVSAFCGVRTAFLFKLKEYPLVIPNGVDPNVFVPREPLTRAEQEVLFVGTLVRKKGAFDLARLINEVAQICRATRFRIIGRDCQDPTSGMRSTAEAILGELQPDVRDRVDYLGEQSRDAVADAMRRASVCAFPSYAEALPISWLEAMACACPIVAYEGGWAREIIDPGEDGFLVPSGDIHTMASTIAFLLGRAELRREIGERARRKVLARFTMEYCARTTLDWYSCQLARRKVAV